MLRPAAPRFVQRGGASEPEADRTRELQMLRRLDERQGEDPPREERLAEPSEEDLHPRLHEDALRSLARAMQLHEAVEERLERLLGGQAEVPGPDLGLQATRLALDLVAKLRRQGRGGDR